MFVGVSLSDRKLIFFHSDNTENSRITLAILNWIHMVQPTTEKTTIHMRWKYGSFLINK